MVNFPILYTGRGTTKPLQGEADSFSKFSDKFLDAEKMKLQKALKDEDWLMNQQVDPVRVLSDKALEDQAKSLDMFNEEVASIMQNRQGPLTTQEKIKVASMKRDLESKQANWMQGQEAWQRDYDLARRDTRGYWDRDAMQQATNEFMETGRYVSGQGLMPTPLNPDVYFNSINLKGTETWSDVDPKTGMYTEFSAEPQEAMERFYGEVQQDMAQGGRLLRGIMNEFNGLPYEEKAKYLDVNGDGRISDEEQQATRTSGSLRTNPIMQWAEQKYAPMMIKGQARKKASGSGSGSKDKDAEQIVYGGAKRWIIPQEPETNFLFGGRVYDELYTFDLPSIDVVFPDNTPAEIVTPDSRETTALGGIKNLTTSGYNPKTDEILFTEKATGFGGETVYAIKASYVPLSQLGELWSKARRKHRLFTSHSAGWHHA